MPARVPILTCINACQQGALGPGKNPLFNRMTNRLATISRPMPRWYVCRISGHINLVLKHSSSFRAGTLCQISSSSNCDARQRASGERSVMGAVKSFVAPHLKHIWFELGPFFAVSAWHMNFQSPFTEATANLTPATPQVYRVLSDRTKIDKHCWSVTFSFPLKKYAEVGIMTHKNFDSLALVWWIETSEDQLMHMYWFPSKTSTSSPNKLTGMQSDTSSGRWTLNSRDRISQYSFVAVPKIARCPICTRHLT